MRGLRAVGARNGAGAGTLGLFDRANESRPAGRMMRAAFRCAARATRPSSAAATPRLSALSCSCGFRTLAAKQAQTIDVQPSPTPTDKQLHQAFDTPSSSYTASPSAVAPTGLFGQPALTTPDAFPLLAQRTTLRAKILVDRLCRPSPPPQSLEEAERAFLDMVKNLDRLSDLLCGVIDLAELVRNVHPSREWVDGANEAYEQLCEYMNELNTHVGLYQARQFSRV